MNNLREHRGRDFEQQDFAIWISKAMSREKPYTSGWTSQLLAREEAPPLDVCLGIAKVCGVDPGWLAYGEDCQAPMEKRWPKELGQHGSVATSTIQRSDDPHKTFEQITKEDAKRITAAGRRAGGKGRARRGDV